MFRKRSKQHKKNDDKVLFVLFFSVSVGMLKGIVFMFILLNLKPPLCSYTLIKTLKYIKNYKIVPAAWVRCCCWLLLLTAMVVRHPRKILKKKATTNNKIHYHIFMLERDSGLLYGWLNKCSCVWYAKKK